MKTSTILLVGATGFFGNEICRQLCTKSLSIKALVRAKTNSTKIEQLFQPGVQVVIGDISNPSLPTFCTEIKGVGY